jgi:CRISPR-associated protein Cmr6
LIFDRFLPDLSQIPDKQRGDAKKQTLKAITKTAETADKDLLDAWNARWEQTARAAHAKPFPLRTDWRFLTGLGRKGPLEVGFTFHRYGFPILPGSSVKGVARAWATFELGGEKEAEKNDDFNTIFGRAPKSAEEPGQSGGAIFFDAVPASTKLPELQLDIMNPHYPDYYGDDPKHPTKYPTDWQSPIPVPFLTVAPGTEFCFAVGWRGTLNATLREKAEKWLKEGLMNLGAGAKTSAGYGYFQPPEVAAPTSPRVVAVGEVAPSAPTIAPVQTRRGVIVEIDTSGKQSGRVRDLESGELYGFSTRVIEGNTPGRKAQVIFNLRDGKVIRVKRG